MYRDGNANGEKQSDSLPDNPASNLDALREGVLLTFLTSLAFAVLPIGALILYQAHDGQYLTRSLAGFVALTVAFIPLRLAARNMRYEVTARLFLGHLLCVVIVAQVFRGMTPGSALLQVVFVLMATLLFGLRGTIASLLCCTASLVLAAVLTIHHVITPIEAQFWDPYRPLVWIRYGTVFLALGGALAVVFERIIAQLQSQLWVLHETLEREREELARREAMQAELERAQRFETLALLAGGIAHDLNNGLCVVMNGAALIQSNKGSPAAVQRLASEIMDTVSLNADTVRQLLTLGRRDDVKPQRVNLRRCLERLAGPLKNVLTKSISLRMDVAADCEISIDLTRFQRALLNLTVNARDAMSDGGTLSIEVKPELLTSVPMGTSAHPGAFVRVDCRDTGIGMDERTRQRVFEPFFTTKGPGKGTGLGLAMVHTVVHDAGGYVEVVSSPGQGTTVSLFFPSLASASSMRELQRDSSLSA